MGLRNTGYDRIHKVTGRYHWLRRRPTLAEFKAWRRRRARRVDRAPNYYALIEAQAMARVAAWLSGRR